MVSSPKNYEEWLSLNDKEKKEVHFKVWNVYEREGIGFAYAAAGRLAAQSPYRVFDLGIGTYHGGEYLLELELQPHRIMLRKERKSDSIQ